MMTHTRHTQSGFTLIEMMLYIALTTGIVGIICLIAISLAEYRVRAYERSETLYATAFATDAIRDLVYESRAVTEPEPGDEQSELTLIDIDQNEVTVRETDGTLIIEYAPDNTAILTPPQSRVTDLTFLRAEGDEYVPIVMSYTLSHRSNAEVTIYIEETMGIRISL